MNNYRLSYSSEPGKISPLPKESMDRIINAKPTITRISDGRQLDNITRKVVNRRLNNCVSHTSDFLYPQLCWGYRKYSRNN